MWSWKVQEKSGYCCARGEEGEIEFQYPSSVSQMPIDLIKGNFCLSISIPRPRSSTVSEVRASESLNASEEDMFGEVYPLSSSCKKSHQWRQLYTMATLTRAVFAGLTSNHPGLAPKLRKVSLPSSITVSAHPSSSNKESNESAISDLTRSSA